MTTRTLAILLFDEVEVLDFAGPFEVFSSANQFTEGPAFSVLTVAEKAGTIRARGGLIVQPHKTIADLPSPEIVLIPGGFGTRALLNNSVVLDWLRTTADRSEHLLSVCTGSLVLGKLGLLDGLESATHHSTIDLLREIAPKTIVLGRRFVDNGKIICSAGVAAGIDMSLHFVERFLGSEIARKTADYMEYPWANRK